MPPSPGIAAVRGAVSVTANTPQAIRSATIDLLQALAKKHDLTPARLVSAFFTTTPDLTADFPAHAARRFGWTEVPLLGATEMAVPGAPPRIVRVLLIVQGVPAGRTLEPVYLGRARSLRPDLTCRDGRPRARTPAAGESTDRMIRSVAVVGLGQIGASLALALRSAAEWRTVGWDIDPAVRRRAGRLGIVDALARSLPEACRGADIAVVAAPVDAIPGLIDDCARELPRGAALIDTGSTRRTITPALRAAERRGIRAVGGHPLAGTEKRGLDAADATLLAGRPFLLLPVGRPLPRIAIELIRAAGARPVRVDPNDHDRALARTSHLPYVVSCALARTGAREQARGLAGPGFAGMTRLAGSDPRMARAYVRANLDHVRQAWLSLRREIEQHLKAMERPS